MIRSFADQATEVFFRYGRMPRAGWQSVTTVAFRKLDMINSARILADLNAVPGNRLEALRADRVGQYSIRINDQWRICFRWTHDGPADVEIVDYH